MYDAFEANESLSAEERNKKEESTFSSFSWTGFLDSVKKSSESMAGVLAREAAGLVAIDQETEKTEAETKPNGGAIGVIENALDTLDDSLEQAEKIALQGISNLASGLTNLFSAPTESKPASPQQLKISDRFSTQIVEAALDEKTYLEPVPAGDAQLALKMDLFRKEFDQIAHAGRIARLIGEYPAILKLMKRLVPDSLSEEEFWMRYYFKLNELELAQKARAALLVTETAAQPEEDIAWSSDEDEKGSPAKDSDPVSHSELSTPKNAAEVVPAHNDQTVAAKLEYLNDRECNSMESFDIVEKEKESDKESDWSGWD
ncbi:hypothetical protein HDV03_005376 [Kappamyces sp. JEL0829]|nr:hypothetical protein HDV03_005376 [Kappamyces sp. JEL0829]